MNIHTSVRGAPKALRQAAILEEIASSEISTQEDLVRALRRRSIESTQVSISRDMAELGLVKSGGRYRRWAAEGAGAGPELALGAWVRSFARAGEHLVVVRCEAGTAQRVGLVLDGAAREGVVGTLAGDDTVFVAVAKSRDGKRLLEYLDKHRRAE